MQRFQTPTTADKLGGEPIEQFGVGRRNADFSEIGWTGHDASAEVMHPNPIDNYAGRQWVVGLYEPSCEGKAPSAGVLPRRRHFIRCETGSQN